MNVIVHFSFQNMGAVNHTLYIFINIILDILIITCYITHIILYSRPFYLQTADNKKTKQNNCSKQNKGTQK